MNCFATIERPEREREVLADEISRLVDEVVFTLEHGVPLRIGQELEWMGRELEGIELPPSVSLEGWQRETRRWLDAAHGLCRGKAEAPLEILRSGRRIEGLLRSEGQETLRSS